MNIQLISVLIKIKKNNNKNQQHCVTYVRHRGLKRRLDLKGRYDIFLYIFEIWQFFPEKPAAPKRLHGASVTRKRVKQNAENRLKF